MRSMTAMRTQLCPEQGMSRRTILLHMASGTDAGAFRWINGAPPVLFETSPAFTW